MAPQLLRRRGHHSRRRSLTARLAIVVAAVIALIATTSGVALAYFTSSGSGTGQASTGTLTIQVTAVSGGDSTLLYPGGQANVLVSVVNPNSYSVHVVSIVANGSVTAGCSPTGVSFTAPTDYTGAQFTLAANSTNVLTLANAASMDATSASGCQGKTFSIPVTVQAQR